MSVHLRKEDIKNFNTELLETKKKIAIEMESEGSSVNQATLEAYKNLINNLAKLSVLQNEMKFNCRTPKVNDSNQILSQYSLSVYFSITSQASDLSIFETTDGRPADTIFKDLRRDISGFQNTNLPRLPKFYNELIRQTEKDNSNAIFLVVMLTEITDSGYYASLLPLLKNLEITLKSTAAPQQTEKLNCSFVLDDQKPIANLMTDAGIENAMKVFKKFEKSERPFSDFLKLLEEAMLSSPLVQSESRKTKVRELINLLTNCCSRYYQGVLTQFHTLPLEHFNEFVKLQEKQEAGNAPQEKLSSVPLKLIVNEKTGSLSFESKIHVQYNSSNNRLELVQLDQESKGSIYLGSSTSSISVSNQPEGKFTFDGISHSSTVLEKINNYELTSCGELKAEIQAGKEELLQQLQEFHLEQRKSKVQPTYKKLEEILRRIAKLKLCEVNRVKEETKTLTADEYEKVLNLREDSSVVQQGLENLINWLSGFVRILNDNTITDETCENTLTFFNKLIPIIEKDITNFEGAHETLKEKKCNEKEFSIKIENRISYYNQMAMSFSKGLDNNEQKTQHQPLPPKFQLEALGAVLNFMVDALKSLNTFFFGISFFSKSEVKSSDSKLPFEVDASSSASQLSPGSAPSTLIHIN
ncbi:MAG: hypothetical protein AAGG80_01185 [Pseudomonadota bacterium]